MISYETIINDGVIDYQLLFYLENFDKSKEYTPHEFVKIIKEKNMQIDYVFISWLIKNYKCFQASEIIKATIYLSTLKHYTNTEHLIN